MADGEIPKLRKNIQRNNKSLEMIPGGSIFA